AIDLDSSIPLTPYTDRSQLLLGLKNIIDGPDALIQDPDVAPTKDRPVGSQKRLPKSSTLRNPSGFEGIVEPLEEQVQDQNAGPKKIKRQHHYTACGHPGHHRGSPKCLQGRALALF
ncbi:MAG: hypothetical protein M1829_000947, partial [Trizodia sp. TS-e1964]